MTFTKDINRFCMFANCQRQIEYNKVKTSFNDPGISQKMRYSQYLRQKGTTCNLVLDSNGNVVN